MSVIETKGLTKRFFARNVLDHVDLKIEENTITGLIGRNGAGKTTLLKMISGYWRPSSGDMHVFGESPYQSLTVSANTIYADDKMNFPPTLTLMEILEQGDSFYANWDHDLACRLLEYFNLFPNQKHDNLSKGKQSTFNMIFALSTHCPLTIMDEPTTGMDAAVREDFYRALLKDYLAHPRTIIISSHYLSEIEKLLENIVLLKNGKKHFHLSVDDVKEYALGLSGNETVVKQWLRGRRVIFEQNQGVSDLYAVIKNELTNDERRELKQLNITVSPVTPNDICLYVTNQTKGGIDDVFNSRKKA